MRLSSLMAFLSATGAFATAVSSCQDDGAPDDKLAGHSTPVGSPRAFDPNNPAASGMVLTFDDEFNEFSVSQDNVANKTRWTDHVWWQRPPAQVNANVHDGVLDIVPNGTFTELTTINSQGYGWAQKYGYFEVRMKVMGGPDLGTGFFLMSQAHAQHEPEPASELDVIESDNVYPTHILNTLHRDSAHPGDRQNEATGRNPHVDVKVNISHDFHTYGALWAPDTHDITWYFDGKEVMKQPKYDTTDGSPMWLDILAGTWNHSPRSGHAFVDYIRAWQFADRKPNPITPQAVSAPFGQPMTNGSSVSSSMR